MYATRDTVRVWSKAQRRARLDRLAVWVSWVVLLVYASNMCWLPIGKKSAQETSSSIATPSTA